MADKSVLDNPIWHALSSRHGALKHGRGLAARYPPAVSPFAALKTPTQDAFHDLATLVELGETVALSTAEPLDVPAQWKVLRSRPLDQMVCDRLEDGRAHPYLRLGAGDVPDMLALALATEPGPFLEGTITMGRYIGIRSEHGRLAAMAGERLRLDGYTEISAVCTDPAFRGRGYARALVAALVSQALAEGCKPFLHVKTENGARGLYESLGFRSRRTVHLTVLSRRQPEPG